jgi:elongation factor 1-gamma
LWVDFAAVVADFVGSQITEVFVSEEEAKTKEFKAKSLTGKYPLLETEDGTLFESAAIARYLARRNPEAGLLGKNAYEAGLVDQWIDFNQTSLLPNLFPIYRSVFGWASIDAEHFNESLVNLKNNIRLINTAL